MPNVTIVPVTDDAARLLWVTWVDWGGEGIVLKDRRAPHRPGERSPDWLKVKHRHRIEVLAEAGHPEFMRWGDWVWPYG